MIGWSARRVELSFQIGVQCQITIGQREGYQLVYSAVSDCTLPHHLLTTLTNACPFLVNGIKRRWTFNVLQKSYSWFSSDIWQDRLDNRSIFATHTHESVPFSTDTATELFCCFPVGTKWWEAKSSAAKKCYTWIVLNNGRSCIIIRLSWNRPTPFKLRLHDNNSYLIR